MCFKNEVVLKCEKNVFHVCLKLCLVPGDEPADPIEAKQDNEETADPIEAKQDNEETADPSEAKQDNEETAVADTMSCESTGAYCDGYSG